MYVLQRLFESSSFLFFAKLSRTPCAVFVDPSLGNFEVKNNTITYTLLHTFSSCAGSLKFLQDAFYSSSFGLKTKLNGQDQDRLGQDQDLKNMVLKPVLRPRPALRPSSL